MPITEVYVGLGGNIGDTRQILLETLRQIESHPAVADLCVSRFYVTSPVSPLPQRDYINAVCRFQTMLEPLPLLRMLQQIEKRQGKKLKPKENPRVIDCDILFYGTESFGSEELQIPHPRWRERLFVLVPLAELSDTVVLPGNKEIIKLRKEIQQFNNVQMQQIQLLEEIA